MPEGLAPEEIIAEVGEDWLFRPRCRRIPIRTGSGVTMPVIPAVTITAGIAGPETDREIGGLRQRLIGSILLAVPVIVMSIPEALQFEYWQWARSSSPPPSSFKAAWLFHRATLEPAPRGDHHGHLVTDRNQRRFSGRLRALRYRGPGHDPSSSPPSFRRRHFGRTSTSRSRRRDHVPDRRTLSCALEAGGRARP